MGEGDWGSEEERAWGCGRVGGRGEGAGRLWRRKQVFNVLERAVWGTHLGRKGALVKPV